MKVFQIKQTGVFIFLCPGCGCRHAIHTTSKNNVGAQWRFNGDVNKPTFSPSINSGPGYCHFFVTDGKIQFCGDSKHKLANQTVELPELEEDWVKEEEEFWDE